MADDVSRICSTCMNSVAYEAGSPWSDSYRGGGRLHPCVPRPAWEIPGAAPEG